MYASLTGVVQPFLLRWLEGSLYGGFQLYLSSLQALRETVKKDKKDLHWSASDSDDSYYPQYVIHEGSECPDVGAPLKLTRSELRASADLQTTRLHFTAGSIPHEELEKELQVLPFEFSNGLCPAMQPRTGSWQNIVVCIMLFKHLRDYNQERGTSRRRQGVQGQYGSGGCVHFWWWEEQRA